MDHGYETRDVAIRPVLAVAAGIGALALVAIGSMWWLLGALEEEQARQSPPASPLAGTYGRREAPEPRLQVHPLDDLRALREEEESRLGSYGWVDRSRGVVRLPIERAMQLVAERGRRGTAR